MLKSKTREEVVSLLGKPNLAAYEGYQMLYFRHVMIDPVTGTRAGLIISFGKPGTFASSFVRSEKLSHIASGAYLGPPDISPQDTLEKALRQ